MPERTFDDFDQHASGYRSIHTANIKLSGADSFYFAEMKVRLLGQFEQNRTMKVLDVGCGDGAVEMYMQRYFPAWKVMGIDVSEKSIGIAAARSLANSEFVWYDGHTIPFNDGEFDIVFMAGVLHHVTFNLHPQLISEVHRVLKGNGRFYLYEHNPLNPLTRHLVNTCVFDKDARLLKSNYAAGLLKRTGFRLHKKQFIIFFPRKGLLSRFIFIEKYLHWLPLGGQYLLAAKK